MEKTLFLALMLFCSVFCFGADHIKANKEICKQGSPKIPDYVAQDFSHILGMKGFDNRLIEMHFKLYQGYVKNANYLLRTLKTLAENKKDRTYEYGALKRRLGWEFDGMRLHEYYFSNLGGNGKIDQNSLLYKDLTSQFGSYEEWKNEFMATGSIRGIGWVVLYEDPKDGRLVNTWINEHDVGHLAGGKIILVMDVFEHAYMPQFGLNRSRYIGVFFDNLNWKEIESRYLEDKSAKKKQ